MLVIVSRNANFDSSEGDGRGGNKVRQETLRKLYDSKWLDSLSWLDNVHESYDARYLVAADLTLLETFRAETIRRDSLVS